MIAWNEYKAAAKQRGSLAMEVYVVQSTVTDSLEQVKQHLGEHLAYQAELEQQGVLMFAGPISDPSCEFMDGTGLIIYKAPSLEAATNIAQQDPMHSSGARQFSVRRWLINEGSLQLNLKLSAQSISLEND